MFIKTLHGVQSMYGNLLDFSLVMFIIKNEKIVHSRRKRIYFEKFPAGHYELKISCDRPVAWSGGFSCPGCLIQ